MPARASSMFLAFLAALAPGVAAAQVPPAAPRPYPYAPYAMPMQGYAPPGFSFATSERRSPTMVTVGAVMIGVGSAAAIAGAALMAAGTTTTFGSGGCDPSGFCRDPALQTRPGLTAGGAVMVALGTVSLSAGIPVLAVGMQRVPLRPESALVPEVRVGAGGAVLSWTLE